MGFFKFRLQLVDLPLQFVDFLTQSIVFFAYYVVLLYLLCLFYRLFTDFVLQLDILITQPLKVHPFLRIYKLCGRFLWVFATEIEGMCGFCRENQGVSRVVEEKSEGIFGIDGFSPYLCIRTKK